MQVDDEDFECLLDVCSNNGIGIDELKNATFFEFSILDEYDYTILTKGALEILCQSGSISNTKGLNDGISDRYRGNITTYS